MPASVGIISIGGEICEQRLVVRKGVVILALITELVVASSFAEDILEAPYEWLEDILEAPIEDFPS